jgi:hypothetical protein
MTKKDVKSFAEIATPTMAWCDQLYAQFDLGGFPYQ